jgi:hypothetical protein
MDGLRFPIKEHYHGTLAANGVGAFALPCGATLVEVSATASNDSDATLQIGTSADADGIMAAKAIGDTSTPVVFTKADFAGALALNQPYHMAKGTIFTYVLDFDGAGGTAAQNVDLLFTFIEG